MGSQDFGRGPWGQAGAWTGSSSYSGPGGESFREAFAGHGSRRRQGPPPWVQELVRSFGGPDLGNRGGGAKVRRGDVRVAVLDVLSEKPMNGYQVIQQIAERTEGAWKPSPGSVYPTIQQLEDEGLVEGREVEGRRLLDLSEAGREYVQANPEEVAATWRPFQETASEAEAMTGGDLKPVIGQVMGAVFQVVSTGTSQQRAEAAEILAETRRKLYGLLADGDPE